MMQLKCTLTFFIGLFSIVRLNAVDTCLELEKNDITCQEKCLRRHIYVKCPKECLNCQGKKNVSLYS